MSSGDPRPEVAGEVKKHTERALGAVKFLKEVSAARGGEHASMPEARQRLRDLVAELKALAQFTGKNGTIEKPAGEGTLVALSMSKGSDGGDLAVLSLIRRLPANDARPTEDHVLVGMDINGKTGDFIFDSGKIPTQDFDDVGYVQDYDAVYPVGRTKSDAARDFRNVRIAAQMAETVVTGKAPEGAQFTKI